MSEGDDARLDMEGGHVVMFRRWGWGMALHCWDTGARALRAAVNKATARQVQAVDSRALLRGTRLSEYNMTGALVGWAPVSPPTFLRVRAVQPRLSLRGLQARARLLHTRGPECSSPKGLRL